MTRMTVEDYVLEWLGLVAVVGLLVMALYVDSAVKTGRTPFATEGTK